MSNDKTPRFRYRLGLNQPAGSPTVRRITEMTEAIRWETDGEFVVEVFPESRLGPDPKMFADMRSGALEFFMAGGEQRARRSPRTSAARRSDRAEDAQPCARALVRCTAR